MSNSRNITAQTGCPYAAGSVDVTTGATPENPGDATFAQAFGAGPIDVYWGLSDSSPTPKSMMGVGSLSGGSIDVSSPTATFDGTTYDGSPAGVITLVSPVIIRCTVNASVFDTTVSDAGTAFGWGNHADAGYLENLSNAEFPDYSVFDPTADYSANGPITVLFAQSNKKHISAASPGDITLTAPVAGKRASCILIVDNSAAITSIADSAGGTIEYVGGLQTWVGKAAMGLYFDGTNWVISQGLTA